MVDFTYTAWTMFQNSGSQFTGSLTDGTIVDSENDNSFEPGDPGGSDPWIGATSISFYGTIEIGGVTYPVFQGDVFSPGSGDFFIFSQINGLLSSIDPMTINTTATFPFCFGPGTMITTPDGALPIESLSIGDLILSETGKLVPVKWLGRQKIGNWPHQNPRLDPVEIAAGALGQNLPNKDLIVSADHGMVLDGYIINASALVNGTTIKFAKISDMEVDFTYYHIETENHDVILANGAPAETFIDAAGRTAFDNHQEYLDLYGTERIIPEMTMPRISSARLVPQAIRDKLSIRHARPVEACAS